MPLFISFANSFTSFCSSKPYLRTSTCLFFISLLSSDEIADKIMEKLRQTENVGNEGLF